MKIKLVKILQELTESEPKAYPNIKGKDGPTQGKIIAETAILIHKCMEKLKKLWYVALSTRVLPGLYLNEYMTTC